MKIGWFVLLLGSLYCSMSSTACAEPAYDNGDASTRASVTFDAERAFAYLKKQCEFGPRPPGSAPHKATQNYLFTELQKFANRVSLQAYEFETEGRTLQMNNILAQFGPQRGETLLLAAHWDTRPIADHDPNPENRSKPILGANDGASGVAVRLGGDRRECPAGGVRAAGTAGARIGRAGVGGGTGAHRGDSRHRGRDRSRQLVRAGAHVPERRATMVVGWPGQERGGPLHRRLLARGSRRLHSGAEPRYADSGNREVRLRGRGAHVPENDADHSHGQRAVGGAVGRDGADGKGGGAHGARRGR